MCNISADHRHGWQNLKTILDKAVLYIHSYWFFIRSRTLIYTFTFAAFIGALLPPHGIAPIPTLLIATLGMYLASLGVYVYNDLTDIGEDTVNSMHRPLIAAKATVSQAASLVILVWTSSLILQLTLTSQAFTMTLLYILLGVVYSHPATSLKKRFPFKTMVTALGGAMSSLIGGLSTGSLTSQVIFAATVFFLFFFILGPLGDIDDVKGDRMQGRMTFPVVIGVDNTIRMVRSIPLTITLLTLFTYRYIDFNTATPLLIGAVCTAAFLILKPLTVRWEDRAYLKKTRNRIRVMHVVLQTSILLSAY